MNNNFRRLFVLGIAAALSLPAAGIAVAEDAAQDGLSTSAPGAVGEAARTVVDRVFGVKGEDADIKYHAFELSNHSPFNAGVRSALIPGWGQRFNRQPVKGAVLFAAVAAGAYGTVTTYDRSKDSYNEYKATGNRNDSKYDDYSRLHTQAFILGGATIALWVYSVFDAYRNAYNPLYGDNAAVQLALNENGASVEWRRRFQ